MVLLSRLRMCGRSYEVFAGLRKGLGVALFLLQLMIIIQETALLISLGLVLSFGFGVVLGGFIKPFLCFVHVLWDAIAILVAVGEGFLGIGFALPGC